MKKLALIMFLLIGFAYTALAHCDTLSGPVIKDAQLALDENNITPVLKWVSKDKEQEVQSAFDQALKARQANPDTAGDTDKKFFETLVAIHRAGEGQAFTGLKEADSISPIEKMADEALDTGSAEQLKKALTNHLTAKTEELFNHAVEKKLHMNDSVEEGREYVEAYVRYLHFVEGVHTAIMTQPEHHAATPNAQSAPEHEHH